MKEFLLFTSAGDKFKMLNGEYNNWNSHIERIFDIYIVYYGDNESLYEFTKQKAEFCIKNKGGKFQNLVYAYERNKELFEKYKYIFVLDNDIEINTLEINFMFRLAKAYNFEIIQPSLTDCSRCRADHWMMRSTPHLFATQVSFIEVNMPLFRGELLLKFLEYLINIDKPILTGDGMDHVYLNFCNNIYYPDNKKTYAIIHGIDVINPYETDREIDNLESEFRRYKHFNELKIELDIKPIYNKEYAHAYECIPELLEEFKLVRKYKETYY